MSKFTFVKTMETEPEYLNYDSEGIPLGATEIGVNTALGALSIEGAYEIAHGHDAELGFWIKVIDLISSDALLDVSTFNCGWTSIQHYLFLDAIEAPEKNVWRIAITGLGY